MNPDRRLALEAAKTVNAVDFVEVDPSSDTTLVIHFLFDLPGPGASSPVPATLAAPLTAANVTVTGGERITAIDVVSVAPRPGDANQLDVTVNQAGDFSVYTLNLVDQGAPGGVPAGFDPASATATFVFHIDCAGTFDCEPVTVCAPDTPTPPPINYLVKDYPGFVQTMLDRLSLLAPRWAERNPADLGVAVVETLAYVADQLSYRQDVVATEAYLGTARLRTSARRHARLVDYPIGEGANARAWLRVLLNGTNAADGAVLPAGTRCCTAYPGSSGTLAHESLAYQRAVNGGAVFFETVTVTDPPSGSSKAVTPVTFPLYLDHAAMNLYNWSETEACLPVGATHATLVGSHPKLAPGMVLVLAEVLGAQTGDAADADPTHRQAVLLTQVRPASDPMDGTLITEIDWHPGDALTFPLCVSSPKAPDPRLNPVAMAWGNIVLADQGRTTGRADAAGVVGDPLGTGPEGVGTVPAVGRFRPALTQGPLTFAAPIPYAGLPAAAAVGQQGTPVAAIVLRSTTPGSTTAPTMWTVSEDLVDIAVGPTSTVFVPEVETDGTAYLLFGDGVNGLRPLPGDAFAATYRVGNGTSGNVARGAITVLELTGVPSGVVGVVNPLPAWGGVDPESVEHVRQTAPVAFRTQERAVTAADYQTWAMKFPGVQRAAATLRWTGSWCTVFVTVEREGQAALDEAFVEGLVAYLDNYRMAGMDLQIEAGHSVPLLLQMSVCACPAYVAADVEQALLGIFTAGTMPDGGPGLFSPTRFNLGQPFYLSPLIADAQAVDGVCSVSVTTFERQDQAGGDGLQAGVLVPQALEFFVLDNDPNYPERGRFDLTVGGGL